MADNLWVRSFPGAITVCDREGIITAMNDKSIELFKDDGGEALIGTSLIDCHPEPARSKLAAMMNNRIDNCYTIERADSRRLVYQTPWYEEGIYMGFVEVVLEIPANIYLKP